MNETSPTGVRLPADLRAYLEHCAAASGNRSLNNEIVSKLSAARDGTMIGKFWESLDLPSVVRMRSSSTSADLGRILSLLRSARPEQLIFGARRDNLNGAALVVVLQFTFLTVVLDTTWLNMARDAREFEIQELFKAIHELGYLSSATFALKHVPETAALAPADALAAILQSNPRPLPSLYPFLDLFAGKGNYDKSKFPAIDE